jgi:diacylglycerol kinase
MIHFGKTCGDGRTAPAVAGFQSAPRGPSAVTHVSSAEVSERAPRPRSPHPWRSKFYVAFRGIAFGVRGQSSFRVHFVFAVLVPVAAAVLRCDAVEWCLLLGCIGLVLTTELLNSTVEMLFRGLDGKAQDRVWPCLDMAAGAVLVASLTAVVIGLIIFAPKLAAWFGVR